MFKIAVYWLRNISINKNTVTSVKQAELTDKAQSNNSTTYTGTWTLLKIKLLGFQLWKTEIICFPFVCFLCVCFRLQVQSVYSTGMRRAGGPGRWSWLLQTCAAMSALLSLSCLTQETYVSLNLSEQNLNPCIAFLFLWSGACTCRHFPRVFKFYSVKTEMHTSWCYFLNHHVLFRIDYCHCYLCLV